MSELTPKCPFCGRRPRKGIKGHVWCPSDPIKCPVGNREIPIPKWNRRAPAGGVDRAQRLLERLYDAGDSLDADAFHKWVDEEFWADLEEYTNAALSPEGESHA